MRPDTPTRVVQTKPKRYVFRRFSVKEPALHRSETVSDEKCYPCRRTRFGVESRTNRLAHALSRRDSLLTGVKTPHHHVCCKKKITGNFLITFAISRPEHHIYIHIYIYIYIFSRRDRKAYLSIRTIQANRLPLSTKN